MTRAAPRRRPVRTRLRRNADRLTPSQLADLRDAWRRSYEIADDRGYAYFAGLHGAPPPIECPHNSPIFLPWHRAYMYFFEMSLRDLKANVTVPYWDWTTGTLPAAFADTSGNNPLASGPIPPAARVGTTAERTFRAGPESLPSPSDVDEALSRGDFLDFNDAVEQLHNRVHGSVGGTMGAVTTAAYDPVFWAHHCFVDRLWRLWQLRHSAVQLPASLLDQALAPFPMTVRQTLSVTALGYDYARSSVSVPFRPART